MTPVVKIGDTVTKWSYLGHFGYGGSSIVLAFQPEVNGKALSYNFAASPAGAMAPLPVASSYQRVGSSQCAPADYELADKISTVDITLTSEELGRATTESVKRLYVIGACAALQQRWTSNNSASWAHPPS